MRKAWKKIWKGLTTQSVVKTKKDGVNKGSSAKRPNMTVPPLKYTLPEPRWSDIISGNSQPAIPISVNDGYGITYYNNIGKPVAYHIK